MSEGTGEIDTSGASLLGGADAGGGDVSGGAPHDGAGGAGSDAGGSGSPPAAWRDDWREAIVGKLPEAERDKELARLKRFASPDNVYKSMRQLEARQSSGQFKPTLPENPTPEEVTAFRKANGIPEKPEEYGLAFPETIKASEEDNADLAAFALKMHEQNAPPGVTKAAFETFLAMREQAEQSRHAFAQKTLQDTTVELRTEWGRDFARNKTMANEFLTEHAGDQAKAIAGLRLEDGSYLGANIGFLKLLANAALATAGDDHLAIADLASGASGGVSLDDRYTELMRMSGAPKGSEDFNKYHRGGGAEEAMKLRAAKDAREARGR